MNDRDLRLAQIIEVCRGARVNERVAERCQPLPVDIREIESSIATEESRDSQNALPHITPRAAVVHQLPRHRHDRLERRRLRKIVRPPDGCRHVAAQQAADD